ncbi:MAG: HAD-IIB family hydrolase [Nitrosomonadales bacterium]|nr:HAD-IIB family hydrolase [Nitrosomonadales bacterium]
MPKAVVISDLDGTLLDATGYSFAAALPALGLIRARDVPLVLCSSKTRAEIEIYRSRMDNCHPFITENGGGIFIPKGYFSVPIEGVESGDYQLILLGTPYAEIRSRFIQLQEQVGAKVRGFADMTTEEVSALTGLSLDEAVLARQRDFDEPFIFEGAPDDNFLRAIEASGMRWTQGRIFHIMGNHDKGHAVNILLSLYRQQFGGVASIALGDSLNDLAMLATADYPVLVRHEDDSFDSRLAIPRLLKTRLPGPAGWNETMLQLLAREPAECFLSLLDQQHLADIFYSALAAVDPYNAVLNSLRVEHGQLKITGVKYDLDAFDRIIVVGAGKATARMALAVESILGAKIDAGLIVVKDGHMEPLSIIEQVEAAHPVPSQAGIAGTQRILKMMRGANEKTLAICLLSGGASALLVAPVDGIRLQDKQEATRLLLNTGASIAELNAVRKHLSMVKGGRLAQAAYPAQVVTLLVSDVIGDPLDVIASGPTAPDNSTFADAWAVILKYGLQEKLPPLVADYLQDGLAGLAPETVKEYDHSLYNIHNVIVASIRQALTAAEEKAGQIGFAVRLISDAVQGEARDTARSLAQAARAELSEMKPGERHCLLCGGETTVTVHGTGIGGRNQELALAFALEIEGWHGVSLLSAGTDGTDGPTDAAGAMVDGKTASHAREMGIDPLSHLDGNNSYAFFQKFDAVSGALSHFKTGPTGTNVMDIQIVLLNRP